jgi:acylphosphatase
MIARLYRVRGRVQGVGFRYFVEHSAKGLGVSGWVRNVDDGSVEVYALGTQEQHSELAGHLWKGPRWATSHRSTQMNADKNQASNLAASFAKYVSMKSAPARRMAVNDSIMVRSRSSQPLLMAAIIMLNSPLT